MSIKFICSCGKHLRAREGMAGRRSFCPKCGQPVGIPTGQPTHAGTDAGPMTPLERLRHNRPAPPVVTEPSTRPPRPAADRPQIPGLLTAPHVPPAPPPVSLEDQPLDPLAVRLRSTRQTKHKKLITRKPWQLERHWYHCLVFPFRAWPLMLCFAVLLTILTAGAALALQSLVNLEEAPSWFWFLVAPCVLIPAACIGYVTGFLDCVITSAAAGEVQQIRWPGWQLQLAFKSCGNWLACFLAGPVVPALVAFYFWLNCGDPKPMDWLVLAELGSVTLGLWLIHLLAISQQERLRDLHPARVVELVIRLGWPVLLVALGAGFVALVLAGCAVVSLGKLQSDVTIGLSGLAASWFGLVFFGCFVLRWLGVWSYHRRLP